MLDKPLVLAHLKSDADEIEDILLTQYIASAVSICQGYCNRKFYADVASLAADYDDAMIELTDGIADRDTAIAATTNYDVADFINDDYGRLRASVLFRTNGVVIDDTIRAAMLLTIGHLYSNREDVVAEQGVNAIQMPTGAKRILEPYLAIGNIAG